MLVYTLTLYPYVLLPTIAAFKAVDVSMEEAAQGLGSSPRRTVLDGDLADRAAGGAGRRAAGVHRDPGEFRRALRAGRGHADLRRRGLQAVHRRDRAQPRLGRRAGRPADPDDGAGAAGAAPLPVGPPLRHQRAPGAADPQGRARAAGAGDDLLLDHRASWRWCRSSPSSCCPSWSSAAPCCTAISASPISPACSTARCARWSTRWSSPPWPRRCVTLVGVPIGYVVTRFRSGVATAARRRGHPAVCRRRHRARHRLRRVVQQRPAGADRRAADHGAGLHRAQSAVRRALGQRHRPPDRRLARGGLDQPRPLAACRPSCASSCR